METGRLDLVGRSGSLRVFSGKTHLPLPFLQVAAMEEAAVPSATALSKSNGASWLWLEASESVESLVTWKQRLTCGLRVNVPNGF